MPIILNDSYWVSLSSWLCLQHISQMYLNGTSLYLIVTDEAPPPNLWPEIPLYLSSQYAFDSKANTDVIIISKDINKGEFQRGVDGRVVLVTNNIDNIQVLWYKYRVLNVIIIVSYSGYSDIYTWSVDNKGIVSLSKIDKWISSGLISGSSIFIKQNIDEFLNRTLKVLSAEYPLFSLPDTLDGPEDLLIETASKAIGYKLEHSFYNEDDDFFQIKFKNGSLAGYSKELVDGKYDVAYRGTFLEFESSQFSLALPSYEQEQLVWSIASPKRKPVSSGLYTGFQILVWMLIVLAFFLYIVAFILIREMESWQSTFLKSWYPLQTALNQPNKVTPTSWLHRAVFALFSLYTLHIVCFYQSTLLINLFKIQYEKEIKTFEEAVDAGLHLVIFDRHRDLISEKTGEIWKKIPMSHVQFVKHDLNQSAVVNTPIIKLAAKYGQIRGFEELYGSRTWRDKATFLQDPFLNFQVTMHMPLGHPLAQVLSEKFLHIIQSGLFQFWFKREKSAEFGKSDVFVKEEKPLRVQNLLLAFNLLLICLGISLVCFITEICFVFARRLLKRECIFLPRCR